MGMEELKLILDTFQQLGLLGQEAFLYYLLVVGALPYIMWLFYLSLIGGFFYGIIKKVSTDYRKVVRDILGVGSPGEVSESEWAQCLYQIRRNKEVYDSQK